LGLFTNIDPRALGLVATRGLGTLGLSATPDPKRLV